MHYHPHQNYSLSDLDRNNIYPVDPDRHLCVAPTLFLLYHSYLINNEATLNPWNTLLMNTTYPLLSAIIYSCSASPYMATAFIILTQLLLLLCHFSRVRLCAAPKTASYQAPLSLGFSRQEHWSGLPFPSPADLPDPGIKPTCPMSPALAGKFFTSSSTNTFFFSSILRIYEMTDAH